MLIPYFYHDKMKNEKIASTQTKKEFKHRTISEHKEEGLIYKQPYLDLSPYVFKIFMMLKMENYSCWTLVLQLRLNRETGPGPLCFPLIQISLFWPTNAVHLEFNS